MPTPLATIEVVRRPVLDTEKAYAIESPKGGNKVLFLPISLTEDNEDGTVTLPEWLAQQKGLI